MEIILPVLLVAGLGLIAGIGLSVASVLMDVPKDDTVERLRELLPGANCGACGYTGCDAYAQALADGAPAHLCAPGGQTTAAALADVLGVTAGDVIAKVAVVHCRGTSEYTQTKLEYAGLQSCAAANQLWGGPGACAYGCLGFGDCAAACPTGAITLRDGLAEVDKRICTGCGQCAGVCPKRLIRLRPTAQATHVLCANTDKGGVTRKVCAAGCIGCRLCVKACKYGAVSVEENLARIDPSLCRNCGACAAACPAGCITGAPASQTQKETAAAM